MTLVVARKIDDRIAIVSDTLVTEHSNPLPRQEGVLKSWILPGNICVSFTNSPDSAAEEFKNFLVSRTDRKFEKETGFHFGFAETVDFFEESSRTTGNDYIVAFDSPPRLIKIADGKRRATLAHTVWIGDQSAYDAFREYELRSRAKAERGRAISAVLFADEPKGSPASDLYSTFRHVIADRTIPSVGGFGCVISNRGNGFRFSAYSDMLYNWPTSKSEDFQLAYEDKIDLVALGENAGYSIAQLAPNCIGLNCVAFYFTKAKVLFVYYGEPNGLADKCHVLRSVEASDLQLALNSLFGVDLGWLALVTTAPNIPSLRPYLEGHEKQRKGLTVPIFINANTFPKTTA